MSANQFLTNGSGTLAGTNSSDNTTYDLTATDNGDMQTSTLLILIAIPMYRNYCCWYNIHSIVVTITINSTGGGAGGVDVEDDGADIVPGLLPLTFWWW